MSKFTRVVRLAAGVVLATGIFAGAAAPADAASSTNNVRYVLQDTGWGG